MNYEDYGDQRIIIDSAWLPDRKLLILDELHKMPDWKNYLKGLVDSAHESFKILVTGSARMQAYSQLGDSLAGRYFKHRLLPLSLSELKSVEQPIDIERLINRGGFPEPYLIDDLIDADRWRMQYLDSLLSTDIIEFGEIKHRSNIKLLVECLRRRVGSPCSYQSSSEDISVSSHTVKRYIEILEALFIVFRVTPYSKNITRSIQKAPKVYIYDTGLVLGNTGAKLENAVAISLKKTVTVKWIILQKILTYTIFALERKKKLALC